VASEGYRRDHVTDSRNALHRPRAGASKSRRPVRADRLDFGQAALGMDQCWLLPIHHGHSIDLLHRKAV